MSLNQFIRSFKLSYVLNNVLNYGKLAEARKAYREFGLKRSPLLPVSSLDMPEDTQALPWLDQDNALEQLEASPGLNAFPTPWQEALKAWPEQGYIILKGFVSPEKVARINQEVDALLQGGTIHMREWARRVMFAYQKSELLNEVVSDPLLLQYLGFILGKEVAPFQSINFIDGSEQRAHSDSIHMTTHPLGYMIAAWVALEEVHMDNGPLFYYPGSHKLPYLLNPDFDHGGSRFRIGWDANKRYEDAIEAVIQEHQLKKAYFMAQPGDLLIWHPNLIHGGDPIRKAGTTRKSMVMHYFAKGVICYHELTQRAAQI